MFTPAEIEGAFRKLFGLYDQEKVHLLRSAFKEEIESISMDDIAWKYSNSAVKPLEFREMLNAGEMGTWQGLPILDLRAAYVAENLGNEYIGEGLYAIQSVELWLLEDMTFAAVLCTEVCDGADDEYRKGVESRAFLTFVEERNDIPIGVEELIYALEDTSLFARAEQKIEAIDEE